MNATLDKKKREGEFYTPTSWTNKAHHLISSNLGKDWKEKYVVWDCACGHLNLTSDYDFKELYSSTLHHSDIKEYENNPDINAFQFDFLNDGLNKIPPGIIDAFKKNKPFIFFINPPYATATNRGATSSSKANVANTWTNKEMSKAGWGRSSQQLYAQFMYRINSIKDEFKLSNVSIAIFAPPLFLTGSSFRNFRSKLFEDFRVQDGFIFPASEFMDVKSDWGVSFTLMVPGSDKRDSWSYEVIRDVDCKSVLPERKELYNTDYKKPSSTWIREKIKGLEPIKDIPQFTSALKWKVEGKTMRGKMVEGGIGYFLNASNNIYENTQQVAIYSWAASKGNGLPIIKENLENVCSLFAARKTHIGTHATWINQKDEYLAPDVESKIWRHYVADSLVYSLFNSASHQSSIGAIKCKGKTFDIRNHMFWGDPALMEVEDSEDKVPTIMYEALNKNRMYMSEPAKKVLDEANEMLYWTGAGRVEYASKNRTLHMDRWDAGYAQLKNYWKESHPRTYDKFRSHYAELEKELRWMTYKVGFLVE